MHSSNKSNNTCKEKNSIPAEYPIATINKQVIDVMPEKNYYI